MTPFPRVVTLIQARVGSTRLPGKVLLPLAGKPLLQRMLERVLGAELVGQVVVITTELPEDDPVAELGAAAGVPVFRGHPLDLLDRHYQAARAFFAQIVVKIPSDCPAIDPAIIDRVIARFLQERARLDYVSNLHPATYPDGNDVEVMSMEALSSAWCEAKRPLEREHTTPFIWERPERFRCANVSWETGRDYSMTHRWTIDYAEDYRFLESIFARLYSPERHFTLEEVLNLLEREPALTQVNSHLAGVNWYRHHLGELRTIGPDRTRLAPLSNIGGEPL